MEKKKMPSASAMAEAEAVIQDLKPILLEMIERNDPAVKNLNFNDIEAHSAAVGDLLAKLLMVRALQRQPGVSAVEEQAARETAAQKARSKNGFKGEPSDLQMTRIPKRSRRLKTARGEIAFSREYLYFPELKTGLFPPGDAPGNSGG